MPLQKSFSQQRASGAFVEIPATLLHMESLCGPLSMHVWTNPAPLSLTLCCTKHEPSVVHSLLLVQLLQKHRIVLDSGSVLKGKE